MKLLFQKLLALFILSTGLILAGGGGSDEPPVIDGIPNQTATVGTTFSLNLEPYVDEIDDDDITYSASSLPDGLSINESTGVISGTPTAAGTYTVTATAEDKDGDDSDTFNIVVNDQDPPVIDGIPDQTATVGTAFSLGLAAYTSDINGDNITYSASGLPDGLSINESTGVISGTPTAVGTYTVTATAADAGGSDSDEFDIIVSTLQAPDVTAGIFSVQEDANNGDTVGTVITTGGPPSSFSILSGNTDNIFQIDDSGVITIVDNSNLDYSTTSSYSLEIQATNISGSGTAGTITINIIQASYDFSSNNPRTFSKVWLNGNEHTNLAGDLLVIGNQSLCSQNNGVCVNPSDTATNNNVYQENINLDPDSPYVNSTSADLTLHEDDIIVDAWLYWIGRLEGETAKRDHANQIYFKTPTTNGYVALYSQSSKFAWMIDGNTFDYGGAVNVKQYIQQGGTYWVAGLQATEMQNQGSGWALAVVVENPDDEVRSVKNISLYDGFTGVFDGSNVYPNEITQTISGFRTPKTETVNSKLVFFSGESDRGLGDRMSLTNLTGAENFIQDSLANPNNIQNATISRDGNNVSDRNPNFANTLGVDIDVIDVSNVIENNQTSTEITLYSDSDRIFLALYGFSTELYIPELCYDYTLDIYGYVLESVDNHISTPFGGFGYPLRTQLFLKSLDGDIELKDVNVTYTIADTSHLTYQDCNTTIAEEGLYDYNNSCDYTYDITAAGFSMYIGTDKTPTSGGIIEPNESRYISLYSDFQTSLVNTDFSFEAGYSVNYGAGNVPLRKIFTSSDLCESDLNITGAYLPELGIFNVVDGNSNYDLYNLYTQVANRPFNLTVYAYNPNFTDLITDDLNLSVEVEMIRADNFIRDAQTACDDQYSILEDVPAKFSHFANLNSNGGKSANIYYDENEVNLAYRSAAMRVWYLTDVNGTGTLVDDHNCTRENQSECIELYEEKYAPTNTQCSTLCDVNAVWNPIDNCYGCLRTNYGRKVCSRDNFAIRPESFVTQIFDSNQSSDIDDPNNQIAHSVSDTDAFSVVAGYEYRFDINATNHSGSEATPRYIQHFSPSSSSTWAKMKWFPDAHDGIPAHVVTGCNDVEDRNISIFIFNGSTVNTSLNQSYLGKVDQIGKYRFEIFDSNWTSADWDPNQLKHHTDTSYAGFFDNTEPDCDPSTSDVESKFSTDKQGCKISSVHENVDEGIVYTYLYAQFYPYTFNTNALSIFSGPDINGSNNFVYINSPGAQDQNMSYNIQGTFFAAGYNDENVTNFVENCYAEDVNMSLYQQFLHATPDTSNEPSALPTPFLTYDLIDFNRTDPSDIIRPRHQNTFTFANDDSTALPLPPLVILQGDEFFRKDMGGAITMDLGYNFNRRFDTVLNPRLIQMNDFNITYTDSPPSIHVDLKTDYKIVGFRNIDQNVSFFYGRAKPGKLFYEDIIDPSVNTPVSIVLHCDLGFTECQDRGIIAAFAQTNEADWWLSVDHRTIDDHGDIQLAIGTITEGGGSPAVTTATAPLVTISDMTATDASVQVQRGANPTLPMTVNIDFVTPPTNDWLIYNEYDNDVPSPFYKVRFIGDSNWTGIGDEGMVVGTEASKRKTKRLDW